MGKRGKTAQLQIRVTDQQKTAIQAAASRAGMDMSAYVLSRVLTAVSARFQECVTDCSHEASSSFALAELRTLLAELSAGEMTDAVVAAPSVTLPPYLANYIAALVEHGCARCSVPVPAWTRAIVPLDLPAFSSNSPSHRLHLLTHSPAPFRHRNIFIDSSSWHRGFELRAARISAAPLTAAPLKQADDRPHFDLLNEELRNAATKGELFLVGGAVMCFAYAARPATSEVDSVFRPTAELREAAARVAERARLPHDWLNDGVKGFMSAQAGFANFLELDHLRVLAAQPEYLLAMKCLVMRNGAGFQDEDDVRYLLRHLDIRSYEAALAVIGGYHPIERFAEKSLGTLGGVLRTSTI